MPQDVLPGVNPERVSTTKVRHVGLIMDGNGRWATRRRLPRVAGHRAGVQALRRVVRRAAELGIEVLTVYAFSQDNWNRPSAEVGALMRLLERGLQEELQDLDEKRVRITAIGRRDRLATHLVQAIEEAEHRTASHRRMHLRLAVDYSSRAMMAQAVDAARALPPEVELDAATFDHLIAEQCGPSAPPLDLLIRTSGEQRLSDFLLWEVAYAELYFTPVLWPDFAEGDLDEAMRVFASRDRRFGGRPSVSSLDAATYQAAEKGIGWPGRGSVR